MDNSEHRASREAQMNSGYRIIGHVQPLRGRKGITAAYFNEDEVPDGTAVFIKITPDENAFDHFQPIETPTAGA
jgi:hypothetical protein